MRVTVLLLSSVSSNSSMFLLVFTFLLYPTVKKEKKVRNAPPVWDVLLIALAIGAFGYMLLNYSRIAQSGGYQTH
ncbi:hypothetical protein NE599_21905, partial [[Clostridium] symbiosum]|uniref:hypothetical protein n=1 Tax=Clostridium symbiosum TaxID=1512 RepID=UPI002109752F